MPPISLFCFAHAGATATEVFSSWRARLPRHIELCPVDLPGRAGSYDEPSSDYKDVRNHVMDELIERLAFAKAANPSAQYAVYGQGAGSRFAFGAVNILEKVLRQRAARCIFARYGPSSLPSARTITSENWEVEFAESFARFLEVPRFGGQRILNTLPAMRADLDASRDSICDAGAVISCPMTLLTWSCERHIEAEAVSQWASHTTGRVRKGVVVPGSQAYSVLDQVRADLNISLALNLEHANGDH